MIEIDHNLKPEPPEPEPAKPILASSLLELEEKQRKRFTGDAKSERIKTGCAEIDGILDGGEGEGIERGIILGVSADGGDGRLISLYLLASILLSHLPSSSPSPARSSKPRATVIDTTGSFPLSLLAKVLKSQILESRSSSTLRAVNTANYAVKSGKDGVARNGEEEDVEKEVQRCLQMVALSRVFDIEGLWEVLGEVGRNALVYEVPNLSFSGEAGQQDATASQDGETQSPQKSAEIIDSDQEEPSPVKKTPSKPTLALPLKPHTPSMQVEQGQDEGTEIIIIDNMTHIINELFSRKEKSDAHTFLTLLSRTMHTLTHASNILTILHNTTVPAKSSYPSHSTTKTYTQPPAQISVFMSNPIKPALGQIFSQIPEVHLLLSKMPKMREDAEVLYGGDEDPSDLNKQREKVINCTVIEVLKDEAPLLGSDRQASESKQKKEFGWREGNWTAVEVSDDGLRFVGAFEEKGAMKGIGMMRGEGANNAARGTGNGVSNVAKIWGFGGRRV